MLNNAKRNEISEMLYARSSVNGIVNSIGVHCATVFWVKKMIKKGKSIECTKLTERKCVLRTEDTAKAIIKLLKEDPTKSMCSFAKELLGTHNHVENDEGGWRKVQGHCKKASVAGKDPGYPTGACKKTA